MPKNPRTPGRPRRPLAAFIYDQATTLPAGYTSPLRASLEAHIERCIAMLDAIDPDCDLEETGDLEPYLAGPQYHVVDCEDDGDDLEPDAPDGDVVDYGIDQTVLRVPSGFCVPF